MLFIASIIFFALISPSLADVTIIQSPGGVTGTITDLSGGVGIYRDAHGTMAVVQGSSGIVRSAQPNISPVSPGTSVNSGRRQKQTAPLTIDEAVQSISQSTHPPTGTEKMP